MAIASWPAGLPHTPTASVLAAPTPSREPARTEYEDGPDRMRRRALTRIRKQPVQLRFTPTQMQTFEGFFYNDLSDGTGHFTMQVFLPGGCQTRRVYIDGATYSAPKTGQHYLVSFTLCIFES
ncbi:hypothetical protein ACUSIJ_07680 [Pseudochelatococcus sp. B33]